MAVYLVAYDLNKETVRPKITEELDRTQWARLSESSYAILTVETVDEVLARFRKHLDENDNFYVVTLKKPYTGWGPQAVNEWLEANLRF